MLTDNLENAWVADPSGHDRHIVTSLDELDYEDYPDPDLDRLIERLSATASGSEPWASQTHWR